MTDAELKKLSPVEMRVMEKLLQIRNTRISFATKHHINTKGEPMRFKDYPHIRQIYNSLAKTIIIQGSVQSMKSEFCIIDHFAAAYCGLPVFFVLSKYEVRNSYVQNRINRCVEQVPEYKKIIGRGFFDNVAMKNFGAGVIKYVGSNVRDDFKEFPADMIVVDEVDRCDAENVEYAMDRMRASEYRFRRYLGNPEGKNTGINYYFNKSDKREWEVPCLKCGEYSDLDWFKIVVEDVVDRDGNVVDYRLRDSEWREGIRRDIKLVCPKEGCGGELDRTSQKGKWVPRNPKSELEGYHISMLCATINSVSDMWLSFQESLNNPGKLKQFYNSYLGLPFDAVGNKITTTLLDNCVDEDYSFTVRPECAHIKGDNHHGPCSMGVDVGGVLDVRISYTDKGVRRCIYVGKVKYIDDLHDLIERYNIEKVVIDSMPETTLVQNFQDDAQCDVWLCHYRLQEGVDRKRTLDIQNRVINIDRTEALDRSYATYRQKKVILPKNYQNILGGAFCREMCLPVRSLIEDARGNTRYEWSKGEDHQRHSDAYDYVASGLLSVGLIDDIAVG